MRRILVLAATIVISGRAMADRYGISESMDEGGGSLSDMALGALIVGVIYLVWKKFFG
jgi:hypothetical protein